MALNRQLTRRQFVSITAAVTASPLLTRSAPASAPPQPNILWITSEDNGPHLGCYGDDYADTPNIDSIAKKGMIFEKAWSNAPVCAPARTTIITGVYPPSTGSQHMRSQTDMPPFMKMYPQYLRQAGYYCTNNSKEDYNLAKPAGVWHDSSNKAHWRNRKPDQPFFAIFNFTTSHESHIRKRPHKAVHDPARVRVPAYHPDTPEVRQDWAQYYDQITVMDAQVGKTLAELKADGLEEDTIIFYYGDHGSGMPRSKRWPCNSGLQVPIVLYIPDKFRRLAPPEYKPDGTSKRLVSFVDLAPTLLSLVGMEPPSYMQGRAFAGKYTTPPQEFLFGFRGRMDERYDMVRSVTDGRYVYLRQYMPHKIYGQYISYMFQTPTTRIWKELYDAGKLNKAQSIFWQKKSPEELYDLTTDPDEVNNLADSPQHKPILDRLRKAQRQLALEIRDLGFLSEDEIHNRSKGATPYEMGHNPDKYPLERIMKTAELASSLAPNALDELKNALSDPDSAVRCWGAMGILMREKDAVNKTRDTLITALSDDSPSVGVIAAQALGQYGGDTDAAKALDLLLDLADLRKNSVFVSMAAFNAIDAMGNRAAPAKDRIAALPTQAKTPPRTGGYVDRLKEKILADLNK